MGRRKISSLIPVDGAVLSRSNIAVRISPLPSALKSFKSKSCLMDALLLTTEQGYQDGFKTIWHCDDSHVSAHVEFAMKQGISSVICTHFHHYYVITIVVL